MADKTLVALTGNIGTGKSTVAAIFKTLGAKVIEADELARSVLSIYPKTKQEIRKAFGNSIFTKPNRLNRKKLGLVVFNNPKMKKKLEQILHPKIRMLFKQKVKKLSGLIIYVIPLLFETNYNRNSFKKIILVTTSPENSIKRVMKRDQCNRQVAKLRLKSQMPDKKKIKFVDYVIKNNADFNSLKNQVKNVYLDFKEG